MTIEEQIEYFFYETHSKDYQMVSVKEYYGHPVVCFCDPKENKKVFASLKMDRSGIHIV